jgi:hypothetical protein
MHHDPSTRRSADPPDLVGVALGALAAGAGAGAAAVAVAIVLLRPILADLLPLLVFAGMVAVSVVAWWLARPVTDWWRRGVTAALSVFGALMLTALTAPADMIAGQTGVAVLAALFTGAALAAGRYSVRSRSHER